MSDDKMRAEFEAWAVENLPYSLERSRFSGEYKWPQMTMHFETYQAGRKAEREAIRLKNWDGIRLGTTGKPEGDDERG